MSARLRGHAARLRTVAEGGKAGALGQFPSGAKQASSSVQVAATCRGEREVPPDLIERVLNHVQAEIARTYNRVTYDAEKRQALASLGDPIDSLAFGDETPSNLIRLA